MSNCIVVGGGIAGLFASILAASKFSSVTLIESEAECGGLLRSWQNQDGVSFDFGTHILSETANESVNSILFKGIYENPDDWHSLDVTKVSNSFNGKLYETGQFIPLHYLDEMDYKLALAEILAAPGMDINKANDLEEYALNNYGETITRKVFTPLFHKMQGQELSSLHPDVHVIFAFNRFIPGPQELADELKKSPKFDAKLAYASYQQGLSSAKKFYPKQGGIDLWVKYLEQQALDSGVRIKTNERVVGLVSEDCRVKQVELQNGETLSCSHLIWSIPPIFAIKAAELKYESAIRPEFCPMSLHHLVFDKPFLDKNYYSNINELNSIGFRLTLYPNITGSSVANCTVEVLKTDLTGDDLKNALVDELKRLGYVAEDAKLQSIDSVNVPMGFPVFSNEFISEKNKQIDLLEHSLSNTSFIGKASRKEFFVYGILIETFNVINELTSEKPVSE